MAPAGGQEGYEVRLHAGEIYAEVVPGHRLAVVTDQARSMVMGTKFAVCREPGKTELIVVQGRVRSQNHPYHTVGKRLVAARQASSQPQR